MKNRLPALDLARVFAMLFMIQCHTAPTLGVPEILTQNNFIFQIWDFMRGMVAPLFLLVSGAVNVVSTRRDESGRIPGKNILKRFRTSLMLFGIGYMLEFPCGSFHDLPYVTPHGWEQFMKVNIMQLFGAALLLLNILTIFLKDDKKVGKYSLYIALAMTAFTPFALMIDWYAFLPPYIASYFSLTHSSIFTIFPFGAYIFFGAWFGGELKNIEPEKRNDFIMKRCLQMAGILLIIGAPLLTAFNNISFYQFTDPMKANPGFLLVRGGESFALMSFFAWFYSKTESWGEIYVKFGRRALFIYVWHIFIIYGNGLWAGLNKFYQNKLHIFDLIWISALVYIAVLILAYYYDTFKMKSKKWKFFFDIIAWAYIFYVIL